MNMFKIICVTDDNPPIHETRFRQKILNHADSIILRQKNLNDEAYETLCKDVMQWCNKEQLYAHNHVNVALKLGIKKIHLSFDAFLQCDSLEHFTHVGVSVHSQEEAHLASKADYLVVGNIYETTCKVGLEGKGIAFLRDMCLKIQTPIYAIGGVVPEKFCELKAAGAKGVCMMNWFVR